MARLAVFLVAFAACATVCLAGGYNPDALVQFATEQWNCTTPECTKRVEAGTYQPNYQCADFVSRCLVAGGYITGLTPLGSTEEYCNYQFEGKTYDLYWVSSVQGPPLGLEDLLIAMGWINLGTDNSMVDVGTPVIAIGSDGPHSHAVIGVAPGLTDAHNYAQQNVPTSVYGQIYGIYKPSNSTPIVTGTSKGNTGANSNSNPNTNSGSSTGPSGSNSGNSNSNSGNSNNSNNSNSGNSNNSSNNSNNSSNNSNNSSNNSNNSSNNSNNSSNNSNNTNSNSNSGSNSNSKSNNNSHGSSSHNAKTGGHSKSTGMRVF